MCAFQKQIIPAAQIDAVLPLVLGGCGSEEIVPLANISRYRAKEITLNVRRAIAEMGLSPIKCLCGQETPHSGRCAFRFQFYSPENQEIVKAALKKGQSRARK